MFGAPAWGEQGHDRGQDGADGDGADSEVPGAGTGIPIGVAEVRHEHVFTHHVDETKGRRTPQHYQQAQESATVNVWLPDRDQSNDPEQLDALHENQKPLAVSTECGIAAIASAPARASVAKPGSAATTLVLSCHRISRTRVSQASPASAISRTYRAKSHGSRSPSIRRKHK